MSNNKKFKQKIINAGSENDYDLRIDIGSSAIIYQIGIQAPYGTEFELNGVSAIVGPAEVFEINNEIIQIDEFKLKVKNLQGRAFIDIMYLE